MIRKAMYAGSWYPTDRDEIKEYLDPSAKRQKVIAGFCPHAGWLYSGKVAGEVYSLMEPSSVYVLIGTNHRGAGEPVSVFPEGTWHTPLGGLPVHAELASAIIETSGVARPDTLAHQQEHSLEVQAPFIKYISPKASIVPISLLDYRMETCMALGTAIGRSLLKMKLAKNTTLIASTDMSHYITADEARKLDHRAIEKVLDLDPEGLLRTVAENDISMCGSGPAAAVLWAAKELGAEHSKLVRYATSGEVTGEMDQVVGYAGMIVW